MPVLVTRNQDGFTLVEVLMALTLMVIGLMGTAVMLDRLNAATTSTKAREQGVALQRELMEAAVSVPYDKLTPAAIVDVLRATPALSASTIGATGWRVERQGIVYSVTAGICAVDDPADGLGTHDPATFCANGTGKASAAECRERLGANGSVAGTGSATGAALGDCGIDTNFDGRVDGLTEADAGGCGPGVCASGSPTDTNPEDYKRLVTLVRWDRGTGVRYAVQSTTVPYPGVSGAPRITALDPAATVPVTTNVSTLSFNAETNRAAVRVGWFIDASPIGDATNTGAGRSWRFDWPLGTVDAARTAPAPGEVVDGDYTIGARAYDTQVSAGPFRNRMVRINRRGPFVPRGLATLQVGSGLNIEWQPLRERDIQGYEVYRRPAGSTSEVIACAMVKAIACRETAPPTSGTWEYRVYASDRDPAGALRRGQPSAVVTVSHTNRSPAPPSNLQAGSTTTLSFAVSSGDPDGKVAGYRVYRDGTRIADRYADIPAPKNNVATVTWTDPNPAGASHDYYVATVDDGGAESTRVGPVRR